jgi:putative transposase
MQGDREELLRLPCSARTDEELLSTITTIHQESRGNHGAPRVEAGLRHKHHVRCSKRRVARLMRPAGLVGVLRGKKKFLTKRHPCSTTSPDLVKGNFANSAPDDVWVADIIQHKTHEGWLWLAVVIDIFSRKVVDSAMSARLYAGLVVDALDIAVAESFFSTLQAELLDKQPSAKRTELRLAIFEYLKVFYNRQRLHATLGYLSPTEIEADWQVCLSSPGGDKLLTVH